MKQRTSLVPLVGLILILFTQCKKDSELSDYPVLFTGEVHLFEEGGAEFTANFRNLDSERVLEFGFLWGETNSRDPQKIVVTDSLKHHVYRVANYSLRDTIEYFVQAYARYDNLEIYGNRVLFNNLKTRKHELLGLKSDSVHFGDTVLLRTRFAGVDITELGVWINETPMPVIHTEDTLVSFILEGFDINNRYFRDKKAEIRLRKYKDTVQMASELQIHPPEIISVLPEEGYAGAPFLITGKGFHPKYTRIRIGEKYGLHFDFIDSLSYTYYSGSCPGFPEDFNGKLSAEVYNPENGKPLLISEPVNYSIHTPKVTGFSKEEVFTGEKVTIYGENFHKSDFWVQMGDVFVMSWDKYEDSTVVLVPQEICGIDLPVYFRYGNEISEEKFYIGSLKIKQPTNFKLIEEANESVFPDWLLLSADYLPDLLSNDQGIRYYINGENTSGRYNNSWDGTIDYSNIRIRLNAELPFPDGWVNLTIELCDGLTIQVDSIYNIPPPKITGIPDTLFSFNTYALTGENFNDKAGQNLVYIDGELITTIRAENPNTLFPVSLIPQDMKPGKHTLYVETNGQPTNEVEIFVLHAWEKITEVPFKVGSKSIVFFRNNKFYIGGGANSEYYTFQTYDLETQSWIKRMNLSTNSGLSVNDEDYGYVFRSGLLKRYHFYSGTWEDLPSLGVSFSYRDPIPKFPPGFLYDGKLYVFPNSLAEEHYTFNISTQEWQTHPGFKYTGHAHSMSSLVLDENGKVYIFQLYDTHKYDPTTYSFSKMLPASYFDGRESVQGFIHDEEAYFYDKFRWSIYRLTDFAYRYISGPLMDNNAKVFKTGNSVYVVSYNEIWKYNLDIYP